MRSKKIETNVALIYAMELAKTNYLHAGYWQEGEELNLKNLQVAQERYVDKLIQFIPRGVQTTLDVGCGVGGNAIKLKEKGFEVEGLAPDPYQEKLFKKNTSHEIPFHLTTFEDFTSHKKFDLVMMSESVEYIPLKAGFEKSREVLKEEGFLLAADIFKKEDAPEVRHKRRLQPHLLEEYLQCASSFGFRLIKKECISSQVLPTVILGNTAYTDYLQPTLKTIFLALKTGRPWLYRLIKLLYRPQVKSLEMFLEKSPISTEPFLKYLTYMIFLFQKNSGTSNENGELSKGSLKLADDASEIQDSAARETQHLS
ncbi:MAG: class I SAM-dependent methyltransferase [Bacteroidota bacterium]